MPDVNGKGEMYSISHDDSIRVSTAAIMVLTSSKDFMAEKVEPSNENMAPH
jgi:hypothetical protein